ncbi:MAG: methionyl-tRNA formyltransferase [Phycisphaerales bacterium JB040]
MDAQGRTDVVFFGSGAFGLPTLRRLGESHRVIAIVTQPDRPAGRGKRLTPNPIASWGAEHLPGVDLIQPENVNEPGARRRVRALPARVWVVIAFGQKLGPELLADRFAINLHASLLPRWRGAAPIHHAILAGDRETGNSVITLADRMDAGEVLGAQRTPIGRTETTGELHDRLSAMGPDAVLDVLARRGAGTLAPVVQDESQVTLAGKLGRDDARLAFGDDADSLRCRVNGLSPWPGCAAEIDGVRVKLLRADSQEGSGEPGVLVDPGSGLVGTGGGLLRLLEIQPAGRTPMAWSDFVRGRSIERGSVVGPV